MVRIFHTIPALFCIIAFLPHHLVNSQDPPPSSSIGDELSGPNVCKRLEDYTVEVVVTEKKPYQERKTVWCANIPPRCTKYEIRFKVVNKTQVIKKERLVRECCAGYGKNIAGNKCVPICSQGCKHGECVAPEQCQCELGYGGPACDVGGFMCFLLVL